MQLIAIKEKPEENEAFADDPLCSEIVNMTIPFYKRAGFVVPWIGYLVKQNGDLVGSAGFKGPPVNGTVEIAYATRPFSSLIERRQSFVSAALL